MKIITYIATFIIVLMAAGRAQDTIGICDRVSNYYYGEEWVDDYSHLCQGSCDLRHMIWQNRSLTPTILVRYCEVMEDSLPVVGIAGVVNINRSVPFADSNRIAEYFCLYDMTDTGNHLVASARWDTATVRRYMEFVDGANPDYPNRPSWTTPDNGRVYFPVYEVGFGKPVYVKDSFYVGGTTFNNMYYNVGFGSFYYDHPITEYVRWNINTRYNQSECVYTHVLQENEYNDKILSSDYDWVEGYIIPDEGEFEYNGLIWPGFSCFFPIFDTMPASIPSDNDTCIGAIGLRILSFDDESLIVNWNPGNATRWELSLVKGDTATLLPNENNVSVYSESFAVFYGLDTGWYKLYIRTVCNNYLRSEWSDSLVFHFPMLDTADTNMVLTTAECYTTMMPNPVKDRVVIFSSFRIDNVALFTLDGKVVMRRDVNGINCELSVGMLPAATYIVRIKTRGGMVTRKLVKN